LIEKLVVTGSSALADDDAEEVLVLLSQNAAFEVFENHIMKEIPVGT